MKICQGDKFCETIDYTTGNSDNRVLKLIICDDIHLDTISLAHGHGYFPLETSGNDIYHKILRNVT